MEHSRRGWARVPVVWGRRIVTGSPTTVASGLFLLFVAVLALFGSSLSTANPNAQNLSLGLSGPSGTEWLGTDALGRSILARTIVGTQSAVLGPLVIALGTAFISVLVGVWSGYKGGLLDSILMRTVDLTYAIPQLILVVVLVGLLGGGYLVAVGLLMLVSVPYDIRVIRAVTLEQRSLPYVEAARTLGISSWRIMFRHLAPNVIPFVIINSSLEFAFGLVTLSGLAYLGIGVPPGAADWGRMLEENQSILFQNGAAILAPGILLVLTAAAVNLLGESLGGQMSADLVARGA